MYIALWTAGIFIFPFLLVYLSVSVAYTTLGKVLCMCIYVYHIVLTVYLQFFYIGIASTGMSPRKR